jgi:uncharacterized protein (TIGR02246 family)
MNEDLDKQKIREVINTWLHATAAGDLDKVQTLMTEDVVFLRPGLPPMRGREAFATAMRPAIGKIRIEATPDIQEIHIAGDHAFCWNQLSVTMTPPGGAAQTHAGPVLNVFRREPDGCWRLFRDANMLTAL